MCKLSVCQGCEEDPHKVMMVYNLPASKVDKEQYSQ